MKTKGLVYCVVMVLCVFSAGLAWAFTEGLSNNFFGTGAGAANTTGVSNTFIGGSAGAANTTGSSNTFMGNHAGFFNTTGGDNTFIGGSAGFFNTTGGTNTFMGAFAGGFNTTGLNNTFIGGNAGHGNSTGFSNTFIGESAGESNTTGGGNTFIGEAAGFSNTTGSGNVFLGNFAGSSETGSNKLYIDNCFTGGSCTSPLIYGEFDTRSVRINGAGIGVIDYPAYTLDVSNMGVSESALHFSLSGTDTGGWITSVADNNFWLSSGAAWELAAGGWVQKSPDGLAVMAGSGPSGYRVMTRSGCAVGTVCPPITRTTIDYTGNVGFGVTPTQPLEMASGAFVSAGGVWTDASSREYKEEIRELSATAAMKALEGLNPVTFRYKAAGDEQHVGFIAEDVPDLVATKDRKGLSPMDIVAVLTKVVREQKETLENQQKTLEEQRQTLDEKSRIVERQQKALETLAGTVAKLEAAVNRLKSKDLTASREN